MERLVKGTHLVPVIEYVEAQYDDGRRRRVYDALSPETRARLHSLKRTDWVSPELVAEFWGAVRSAQPDAQSGFDEMVRVGRLIAQEATNTFMQLLIKLMNPQLLGRKWPAFWAKTHNFGRLSSDTSKLDDNELTLIIEDVDGYDHIGATAVGFVGFALESMGLSDVRVVETECPLDQPSAPRYRVRATW